MRHKAGALLGVWLVVNILAYRWLVRSGWPSGGDAPSNVRFDLFDAAAAWVFPVSLVLGLLVPVMLVAVWKSMERRTGIDQAMVTSVCRWSLDVLKKPASIAIVIAFVALLLVPVLAGDALWFFVIPALLFLLLLPLGVFDARVAASPTGDGWWVPGWPGWKPLLAAILLFTIVAFAEQSMDAATDFFPWLTPFAVLVSLILGVFAVTLQGSILLFRLTPGEAIRRVREILTWQRLGSVIAVQARLLFASLFFIAPLIVAAAVVWKLVPHHASWIASQGGILPWSARILTTLWNAFEDTGGLGIPLIVELVLLLLVSRVLWLTRADLETA